VTQAPKPAMSLLHLYADEDGETHLGTTEIALPLQDFAPPAAPFNASDAQFAKQYVLITLPVGWVGEAHTSPQRQVLFCLSGSLRITCSTGEVAMIDRGMGVVMSDVSGRGHKSEVTSAEPVSGVIIQ
jgi:hypothetical protein